MVARPWSKTCSTVTGRPARVACSRNTRVGERPKVFTWRPVNGIQGWSAPLRMRPEKVANRLCGGGSPRTPAWRR